jgi:hypothetical protein
MGDISVHKFVIGEAIERKFEDSIKGKGKDVPVTGREGP